MMGLQFTSHVVNIKEFMEEKCVDIKDRFTSHVVNIKGNRISSENWRRKGIYISRS